MGFEQDFQEVQRELSRKFAQRTLDDAVSMGELLGHLGSAKDQECRGEIRFFVHRLAGSAAIFGYANLSDPAWAAELAIDNGESEQVVRTRVSTLIEAIGVEIPSPVAKSA